MMVNYLTLLLVPIEIIVPEIFVVIHVLDCIVIFHYICYIESVYILSHVSMSLPVFVQYEILFISVTSNGTFFCGQTTVVVIPMITSTEP